MAAKAMKRGARTGISGIAEIRAAGFKSIADEQSIEVRPLTVLAGANSSGKSSMLQPLLLLKQTLEAPYDPGPIFLNGPNVKFTQAEQLLSRLGRGRSLDSFHVTLRLTTGDSVKLVFRKEHKTGFHIQEMEITEGSRTISLWPEMTTAEIAETGVTVGKDYTDNLPESFGDGHWEIKDERCFLEPAWVSNQTNMYVTRHHLAIWEAIIPTIIHVPGLRGNPERAYPIAAVGDTFPGTFEKYTASVISSWADGERAGKLDELNAALRVLALTEGVSPVRLNDAQIELHVGRLPGVSPKRPDDRVNIADVGIGVSQVLPVLTALLVARPGQLVYLEQPEIHLHPRAQVALAQILADAANRSVRVVVETHSSLLLLGVQSLVAEEKLAPDKVKLHWFSRSEKTGSTTVTSGDLDEAGRYGDWPEDFDDVSLHAQKEYLDAAEARLFNK